MILRFTLTTAAACLLAALPCSSAAQEPGAAAAAFARIAPGSTVRVQTYAGSVLEGTLQLAGDSVRLDAAHGPRAVALSDVRSAWLRERRTRTGAVVGALLGGAGGGAFLGFLGLVVDVEQAGKLAAIGVLGGAGAGGLLGGVVGAAVPRWTLIHPADAPDVAVPPPSDATGGRRRLGALEASAGFGRIGGEDQTDGGPGGRIGLHAEFGADPARPGATSLFFSLGPEIGWFDLGATGLVHRTISDPASPATPPDTLVSTRSYTAFTAGGLLRAGIAARRVRGYGLAGLAYNRWDSEQRAERWTGTTPQPPALLTGEGRFEHLGYSIGAGAQAALGRDFGISLELRRTAVGTFDMDIPGHYWSFTLGASRRW